MAPNILPFPPRGGNGFNILPQTKLGMVDQTNLYSIGVARGVRELRQQREEAQAVAAPRSPELLLALLAVNAADNTSKRIVRLNIEHMAEGGDEDAEALLWWTRNLPNAEVTAAGGKRTPIMGEKL